MSGAAPFAVVLPTTTLGGHELMLLEWLAEALRQGAAPPTVYGNPGADWTRRCAALGLPSAPIDPRARRAARGQLGAALATWRLLGRLAPTTTLLFAPGVPQAAPLQWLVAALRRRRIACYVPMTHSAKTMGQRLPGLRDTLVRALARRVALWITIDAAAHDGLRAYWRVGAPIHVVPNRRSVGPRAAGHGAVEPARVHAHSAQRAADYAAGPDDAGAAGPAPTPLRLLFAGRFDARQKGLDWLAAWWRVPVHRAGRHLTLQGRGDFEPALRRLAADLGAGAVTLRCWGDIAPTLGGADVLLLPSRYEGLPLVALEAIQHGVAVVASRNAGLGALLPAEALFDFGDAAALHHALQRLHDPARRVALVAHAARRLHRLMPSGVFERAVGGVMADLTAAAPACAPAGTATTR